MDVFVIKSPNLGTIKHVTVSHDNSGPGSGWHLDYIDVFDVNTGETIHFAAKRWLSKARMISLATSLCFLLLLLLLILVVEATGIHKLTLRALWKRTSRPIKRLQPSSPVEPRMRPAVTKSLSTHQVGCCSCAVQNRWCYWDWGLRGGDHDLLPVVDADSLHLNASRYTWSRNRRNGQFCSVWVAAGSVAKPCGGC